MVTTSEKGYTYLSNKRVGSTKQAGLIQFFYLLNEKQRLGDSFFRLLHEPDLNASPVLVYK